MIDDSDAGGAPPAGVHSNAHVVNNWGAGVYVGTHAGIAFANGDIAEYNADLAGFVRVLTNVGGFVPANYRFVVIAAAAAGSFLGQENNIGIADGAGNYAFEVPTDGRQVRVIGEEDVYENQNFIYDAFVARWLSQGVINIPLADQIFVDKGGDDVYGTGSIEQPFETIGGALAVATAGDNIVIEPGIYAETLLLDMQVNLVAMIPGTVTIQGTVPAGAVVEISGAAIGCVIDGINITNLSAAGIAGMALLVDNTGGTITGPITYSNGNLISGAGLSTAFAFIGDALGAVRVNLKSGQMTGIIIVTCEHANDVVLFDHIEALGGVAGWMYVDGTDGRVLMNDFLLATAAAGETLSFGAGAATGVTLSIGNSAMAGILSLDNLGGTGLVVMTAGNQIGQIVATENDQIIQRWYGEDEVGITLYNLDANAAPAVHNMLTTGLGRTFNPHTARPINRGVATGALLDYRVNGSGVGTVVAAVGAGILGVGIAEDVVTQDQVPAAGNLALEILAASGVPGDVMDYEVIGRMF